MLPIESPRLRITTWSREDVGDAVRLWGDPRVMKYIDLRGGLTEEQVAEKLQQEIDRQEQHGVQYWKVTLKQTGETIGCCGLRPYELENRVYELGFHLMADHWGHGYAPEAAHAVIRYAFEVMRVPKLFAGHNPQNAASASILLKLGFRRIADTYYPPQKMYHPSYELEAPQMVPSQRNK